MTFAPSECLLTQHFLCGMLGKRGRETGGSEAGTGEGEGSENVEEDSSQNSSKRAKLEEDGGAVHSSEADKSQPTTVLTALTGEQVCTARLCRLHFYSLSCGYSHISL